MTRLVFLILTGLCLTFSVAHAQQVKFVTSMGDITVEVDPVKAPITTENFLRYVRDGFYDGTLFHRVINGFVLQGGGFNEAFEQKPTRAPILNEANNLVKNRRGTLSMARTSDPHSATAQYFINVVDNPFLDHSAKTQSGWGYAVFAKVIDGMDVVDQIKEVATGNFGFYQNVPITPVVVISATILIPPAPYVQSDLEGHWNLIHFGDDARTPNSPWAETCEFDFAASGTLNAGTCTDTNGVLETFKRKAFKALISEFGEVNFNEPAEDNITLADAQMDLGRRVIARIAAIDETDTLAERILEVFVAQGAGYLQSDLDGTWHLFQYGDEVTLGSNAPSWKAGSITLNTLGTITQGAFSKDDDPLTLVNVASGSATLDDHGVVSATGNWVSDAVLLDERLDSGMSVIAGVARETFVDPKSNDNLRIWVKQGHRYSQNDASGFWYLYVFSDQSPGVGDPENIPDVSKYFISVSNTGELSGNGFASDQQAFQLQGQMLVDDEGGVTFTGNIGSEFLFHKLQMDAGKTVVAGVANKDDQSTYRPALIMAVKSAAPAKIISPIPGASLEETIQTFDWVDNGNDINLSRIYVGTRPGTKDLFDSGNLDESIRTVIAPGLPNDGSPVYVRLRYRVAKVWKHSDSQYLSANIANVQPPSLLAPLPGSLLAPSLDQATQFQWATNGTSVTRWQLLLGDTPGASNIHNSGTLGGATLTTPVLGLPADGRTLHARLRYFDRAWKHIDVQYLLPDNPFPSLTSPSQGSTFTESEVTFQWSLNDHPVQDTELWVGSKVGGKEFANLRGLGNSITTVNVGKLPSDGRGIFVRLRYRIFGKWAWADYSFKASDTPLPALTNPTPGTVLSGANVTFNWNNAQHAVTDTQLLVGTRAGRGDLANSRSLDAGVTSFDVQGLPADGRSIYVRLRSRIAGKWLNADYTFTANNFVLPELTAPNAGATLADSELFTWDHKGHPVQDTELWVGTGFAGKQIAYHRKLGTLTEQQVENLPTSGQPVYVRLRSKILGKWNYKDYQFKASGDPLPTLTSPAPGSSLSSAEVTFDWDLSGLVVQDTQLLVGNKPGASNLGKSALLGVVENASYTATGLPADGRLVYVRLRYRLAGKWKHHDYTFTAADLALPALIFPAPVENPAKLTGADVTFIWDHNEHQVTDAQLLIGSRIGRSEFANSRSLGAGVNSFDAQGLPTDGRTLYVRLRSRINGKWANADYTFPAASFPAPTLISPTQGATLGNTTQTFQWDFKGHPIQDTELSVGTSLGGKQIINQRKLGTATEFLVADLPANGRPLYVRLRTRILGKWLFKDYQFKASGGGDEPTLNSPALGTILTGAEVSFDWDMNGLSVEDTQLLLGSKPGASDLARSDFLGAVETASFTATTLPADGRRVFVRLRYRLAGKWKNLDYVYSAANFPVPSITSQSAIDALTTFNWDSNGHAVSDYQVLIGSRKGLGDLAKSKLLDSATSTFEAPLPTDGRSISVRLRSRIGGKWFNSDSSFNALTLDQPGLTSPALGESINSQTVNFQWSFNGHHVQDSELWVGSSFSGKQIAIATGLGGNTTEFQVDNIPANARTVYIRLRYLSFGKWLYSDYVVPVELLGNPG